MKQLLISEPLVVAILNYLETRPFKEVEQAVGVLRSLPEAPPPAAPQPLEGPAAQ